VTPRIFQYLPLCVLFLTACDPAASRSPADAITFDTTKRPDDFDFADLVRKARNRVRRLLARFGRRMSDAQKLNDLCAPASTVRRYRLEN
jgi:hypothetical protein